MLKNLITLRKVLGQAAHLMVGLPDYDTYVAHMRAKHPEQPLMSYEEFFRERQQARYGGRNGRAGCC
ncbi:MAG TPA: YbdD/YjiX family protein [Burkholderiales bacterium]